MSNTEPDLSSMSNEHLADTARDAIIERNADLLDRAGAEIKKRADKDREDGSAFQKIAKVHREEWQRRAKSS